MSKHRAILFPKWCAIGLTLTAAVFAVAVTRVAADQELSVKQNSVDQDAQVASPDKTAATIVDTELPVIVVSNELDTFLAPDSEQWEAYQTFFEAARTRIRAHRPDSVVGTTITFNNALSADYLFAPDVIRAGDAALITYYPLDADFRVRDPGVAGPDIEAMVDAAGRKRVFFQEIGYPTSARLGSSEAMQAEFLENVFAALRQHPDRVIAANFLFLSDLPRPLVEEFGSYYGLEDNENFKAYLETLGWFTRDGRARPAWEVFRREAGR